MGSRFRIRDTVNASNVNEYGLSVGTEQKHIAGIKNQEATPGHGRDVVNGWLLTLSTERIVSPLQKIAIGASAPISRPKG
jgi:hypothetical protein